MANFTKELPRWESAGIQPPDNLLKDGWKASQRPPADYFNWFFSRTYNALKELQDVAAKDSDLVAHERLKNNPHDVTPTQIGLGNLINQKQATKIEFDTHNEDLIRHILQTERNNWNSKAAGVHTHQWSDILGVPIAGLSQKGIIQLLDSVVSTDKTMAATPNAVKSAYDRGSAGIVDAAASKKIAEDHIANKANPHGTTKALVGLASVQDYGIASITEAQTGALTNRYMTPFLVNEAIKSLQMVKSVNGKTGEVVISKSDVGLGNVDNVKQASKTEFDTHNSDSVRHVTTVERDTWNGKMNTNANAVSATKLQTARKIAGKLFDGTADVDITTTDINLLPIYAKKITDKPSTYAKGVTTMMVRKEEDGWISYGSVTTFNGYSNGGGVLQIYSPYAENLGGSLILFRLGVYPTDTWTAFLPLETTVGAQAKSTAVQSNLNAHTNNRANPHETTKTHVGLGSVDNVQQATKVEFNTHNGDATRHMTAAERTNWNGKLNANANAVSATKLATARTIAGIAFDGTGSIAIPAGNVGAYTKAETATMISTAQTEIYQKVDDKLASKQDTLVLTNYAKIPFTTGGMQGELRYRTYGKMVEIEGSMVNWRLSQGLGPFATAPKRPGYTRRYPIYSIDNEVQEGVIEINSNGEMILIKNPAMGSQYSFSFNYFDN